MAYNTRRGRSQGYNARPPAPVPAPVPPPVQAQAQTNLNNHQGSLKQENPVDDSVSYTQPAFSTQSGYNPPKASAQPSAPTTEEPPKGDAVEVSEGAEPTEEGNGEVKHKAFRPRPWKKNLNFRVSKKIRKRRQNAKLRQMLTPKNAMMVLHELHPELKIAASEQLNAANQMVYTVDIEIDGKVHRGQGMSKLAAKQAGCENALKAILLEKMAKSQQTQSTQPPAEEPVAIKDDPMETTEAETENAPKPEDGEGEKKGRRFPEDDVPWGSLASFALYKLFSEWQAQGFQLPPTTPNIPPIQKVQVGHPTPMAPMKKIPDDANQKHPVQLLNQLRPGSQYSETREGTPPNLTFTFTVIVDSQTFTGTGNSKKDAKKECAKAALEAMGVKYN